MYHNELIKFYAHGAESRTLHTLTSDMKKQQWRDWIVLAGIHMRTDVDLPLARAQGAVKVNQSLSIRYEHILIFMALYQNKLI
jgi:hypothetical protein